MTVFQFMIGNTDWSTSYKHNIRVISGADSTRPIPVAYDFDFCGLVNAPYALPPEELQLASVRDRRYRGYCIADLNTYSPIFDYYRKKRPELEAAVDQCEGLNKRTNQSIKDFIDSFYDILEKDKEVRYYFGYPCDASGTGNINIKGLNKNN
jgi:hypothetical protein